MCLHWLSSQLWKKLCAKQKWILLCNFGVRHRLNNITSFQCLPVSGSVWIFTDHGTCRMAQCVNQVAGSILASGSSLDQVPPYWWTGSRHSRCTSASSSWQRLKGRCKSQRPPSGCSSTHCQRRCLSSPQLRTRQCQPVFCFLKIKKKTFLVYFYPKQSFLL